MNTSSTDDRRRERRHRRCFAPLVVAVTAGALALGGCSSATTPPPTGPAPVTAAPTSPPTQTNTGKPKQPTDPDYLTAAPAAMRFQDVGGLTLPFSPVDGPLRVSGPIAAGYSHTPQGAVLAAMQLLPRIGFGPDYRQVVAEQVVADQAIRDQLISYRATHPQDNPAELAAQLTPPAGFRIESYAPDRATVVMLNRPGGNAGGFTAGRALVVWVDGDWKLPDNSSSTLSPVPDSTGYTLF